MSKTITLKTGHQVLVDDSDYDVLVKNNWVLVSGGYPGRITTAKGKTVNVIMHRVIMGAKKGEFVDHKNMNRLDNRRENLRLCTKSQNEMNRTVQKNSTTGIKGVHKLSKGSNFTARIGLNKKQYVLGCFGDKNVAADYYGVASLFLHGEFSRPL